MEHLWAAITPFWLSTDDVIVYDCPGQYLCNIEFSLHFIFDRCTGPTSWVCWPIWWVCRWSASTPCSRCSPCRDPPHPSSARRSWGTSWRPKSEISSSCTQPGCTVSPKQHHSQQPPWLLQRTSEMSYDASWDKSQNSAAPVLSRGVPSPQNSIIASSHHDFCREQVRWAMMLPGTKVRIQQLLYSAGVYRLPKTAS